jgi:hypothetical protein
MGVQFAEAVTRMTERVRGLGLNPLRPDGGHRSSGLQDGDLSDGCHRRHPWADGLV